MKAKLFIIIIGLLSVTGCDNKQSETTIIYEQVKIVNIKEVDSMMRFGASGCTTIEYTNGVRHVIGGIYGKVGDVFTMPFSAPKK